MTESTWTLDIRCRLIGGGDTVLAETVKSGPAALALCEAGAWADARLAECQDPDARVVSDWIQRKQFKLDYTPHVVHRFGSTSEAYDASQTHDEIKDGDILSVPSERVVGILTEAWPVAVSEAHGEFHTLTDAYEWDAIPLIEGGMRDYSSSLDLAVKELDEICGNGAPSAF